MSKHSYVALIWATLGLAACERPTAPEARDYARNVEQKFARGDWSGVTEMMMFMGNAGNFLGSPGRRESLSISRDGRQESINGAVFEEVLVAPGGLGRPVVRRSLAGWPSDIGFAVYAATETFPGVIASPLRMYEHRPHVPGIWAFVLRRDTLHTWVAQTASVQIGDPIVDRECEHLRDSIPLMQEEKVECHIALYEVALHSEMLRRPDHDNRLTRSLQHRHSLDIPMQRIPGVRFTTHCPDNPMEEGREVLECSDPIVFWRNNDQYAEKFGIDVARMERPQGVPGWYKQSEKWPDDSKPQPVIRSWTLHTADGTLLETGTVNDDGSTTPQRDISDWPHYGRMVPGDMKVTFIAPAIYFERSASLYDMRVLTVEMAPSSR